MLAFPTTRKKQEKCPIAVLTIVGNSHRSARVEAEEKGGEAGSVMRMGD